MAETKLTKVGQNSVLSILSSLLLPWKMEPLSVFLSSALLPKTANRWLLLGSVFALLWGWFAASFLWPVLYMVGGCYTLICVFDGHRLYLESEC